MAALLVITAFTATMGPAYTQTNPPSVSGSIAAQGASAPGVVFLDMRLANNSSSPASNIRINQILPRTMSGTGTVTYNTTFSPALPILVGDLPAAAFTTVRLYFSVPSTVLRFSITENGTLQDSALTTYNFSVGQAVIPPATSAPVLTLVNPNAGRQGQTNLSVQVTGQFTHFVQGTTQVSFGAGITVNNLIIANGASLTADISIDANAVLGTRTVTVTTAAEVVSLQNGFSVTPGTPVLTTVNPNTGRQGQQNLSVNLTGQFTHWLQGTTTASFGTDITVNSVTVANATSLTADISIDANAVLGTRTVTVTTAAEVVSLQNGFSVTPGTPVLTTVNPNTGRQGQQNLSVNLTGQFTHWLQGTTTASFGTDITVNSVTVANATSLTADISLAANAAQGFRTVSVLTGAEIVSLANAFNVTAATIGLPPDPVTVAPPNNPTVATNLRTSTEFLYTGANPIQTGMGPAVIALQRAAVVRGKVMTRDGAPLSGVQMTVIGHAEFGQTLSRADGVFDMAVNGGTFLSVRYDKPGFLSAQRQVYVPWQDFALFPDVVLIQPDSQVTPVDLTANVPIQVARGNTVTDGDGTRQSTLLFSHGTTATMLMPDGSIQPLTRLNVRATEFTVGPTGPAAMPGELPPTSGYTYAVELTADEAIAAGAKTVNFSQPVIQYVENFLNFPVGIAVPVGFLDRERSLGFYNRATSAWIGSENGRVIQITGVSNGVATVDTVGTGSLPPLTLGDAERQQLAALYAPGQRLWRVPIPHFSPWDYNWPHGAPPDARAPGLPAPHVDDAPHWDSTACGSIIQCQSQNLGEVVPISGTPFHFHYSSDRAPGRAVTLVDIPLSGSQLPSSLLRIDLDISLAGRRFFASFPPTPNQHYAFTWDGLDVYGREAQQGGRLAVVRVGYVYGWVYRTPAQLVASFAAFGGALIGNREREVAVFQVNSVRLGALPAQVGGWSLSSHHGYDPNPKVLYQGDGERRDAQVIGLVITTVVGNGTSGFSGDGGPATQAVVRNPLGVAVAQDGTFYIADTNNARIRRVSPAGIITTVAGTGASGSSGDGGPATQATLRTPRAIAVAPDGSFYFADNGNHRIRRVGPDGIITTVAGTGAPAFSGDGGAATQAALNAPTGVAVAADGSFYIADQGNHRIRRVGPDGIITTVAGTGASGSSGDGGPATQASFSSPQGVAVAPDGSLYIADTGTSRIRRVGPDGIITTVAGTGAPAFSGDGGPATQAALNAPIGVAVAPDGSFYIADQNNHRIRRVGQDGILTTVAGIGGFPFGGDGGLATQAASNFPRGVAVAPDGSFFIVDGTSRIRQVASPLPGFGDDLAIASEDGTELYRFDADGRHLQTLNALTGAVHYQFTYDSGGRLTAVTDGDGNVTTIEHDASGNPTAVVAPFGQRTALAVDSNGLLSRIVNPAGEAFQFSYTSGGLLTSATNPRGNVTRYTYDALGRLVRADDAAGGFKTLTRTDNATGYTVALQTGLGRTTTYSVERLSNGARKRTVTDLSGAHAEVVIGSDGSVRTTDRDGTIETVVLGPDPRWGMQAPVVSTLTVTTPGGLTRTVTSTKTAALANLSDPLSMQTQTGTISINGRTFTSRYDSATRTLTQTSAAARTRTIVLDAKGRIVLEQVSGLLPTSFTYDSRGRLSVITEGSGSTVRTASIAYGSDGFPASMTDPLGHVTTFTDDAAGRPVSRTTPDGQTVALSYDASGNLTSLTPPGSSAHGFSYTAVNLTSSYAPPNVGASNTATSYTYDIDRQLTRLLRPDSQSIDLAYDSFGRLTTLTQTRGALGYSYDSAGRLTGIMAPGGAGLASVYDGFLRTGESATGAVAGAVTRGYDTSFRVTNQSVNGSAVTFAYDDDDLTTQAGALSLTRSAPNGLLGATSLGTITTSFAYTGFAELSRLSAAAGATLLYDAQYTRDSLGRITRKTETLAGVPDAYDYTYDLAGRLLEVRKNGALNESYAYGANSNRTSATVGGATIGATYDAQDRLLTYGNTAFTHTAAGEWLTRAAGGQTTTYTYDALGNLTAVSFSDGREISYLIDGKNRRVGKSVNGTQVQGFLYQDQLRPIAELNGSGAVVSRFVYARGLNVPAYMIRAGVNYRILTDHLGSVRLVVNSITGQVVQRIDYDSFGNVLQDTNPGFQPFGFAGGLSDPDTKFVRFGARDYNAETGRWTAKDRIGFAGGDSNLYAYVASDPINHADIAGLWAAGISIELSTINPFTSGGGGAYGINLEYTSSGGLGLYTYGTPNDLASSGWAPGVSAQVNGAWGTGEWTGLFEGGGGGIGVISGSYFNSPDWIPDDGYYLGASMGVGVSPTPLTLGFTTTNYTDITPHPLEWLNKAVGDWIKSVYGGSVCP